MVNGERIRGSTATRSGEKDVQDWTKSAHTSSMLLLCFNTSILRKNFVSQEVFFPQFVKREITLRGGDAGRNRREP
jgi:hypothetical protein